MAGKEAVPNQKESSQVSGKATFIIGIGASAGGLEALQDFLSNFPQKLDNVAIVIAQHLSPTYKSMLVQLLSRATELEVVEVANMMKIEEGKVFITPPDSEISLANGKFILHKPASSAGPKPSVDVFFNSLAVEKGSSVIAVILSGTGTDGSKGLKKVKESGGLTIAQEPETAKYDGMPLAAIQTGYVDLVLSPDKMGEEILEFLTHGPSFILQPKEDDKKGEEGLSKLLKMLSERTGTDFANYKHSTICRRLEKRLLAQNLKSINEYLDYIQKQPKELDSLFETILIGVTQFFRDKDAFDRLSNLLKEVFEKDKLEKNFRIWVPGCATGEEPYSIAILISELLGARLKNFHIQIFATDIDERAIEFARRGIYEKAAVENLSADVLGKYFNEKADKYEIAKSLKQMVLFSKHDITVHPPFLKLSLISCRNLLIYFGNELQKHIIPIFHYSLKSDHYLFLGKSETVGQFSDLFTTVDGKYKIFRRKKGDRLHTIRFSAFRSQQPKKPVMKNVKQPSDYSLSEMVMRTLYNTFEFPYVIVNDSMDILEIFGNVSQYLNLPQGSMNANIINLVNKEIQIELRSVLSRAIKDHASATGNFKKLPLAFDAHYVRISVRPLIYSSLNDELYIVIFERYNFEDYFARKDFVHEEGGKENLVIKELEQELASTKEHLQTYIEELETANEELQSLNEELQSSNEELQSSNEELETSNEELQSSNEEIQIAYSELRHTNQELEKKEDTLRKYEMNNQALLNNTLQSFILIDRHYRIIAYNKGAQEFSKLFMEKVMKTGDTIMEFRQLVELTKIHSEFDKALRGKVVRGENSIRSHKKNYYFIYNFTPVLDDDGTVNVISLGLIDVTDYEKMKSEYSKSEKLVASVFNSANIGIAVFNQEGEYVRVNEHYCNILGYSPDDLIDKPFTFIVPREFKKQVAKKVSNPEKNTYHEIKLIKKDGEVLDIYETRTLLEHEDGTSYIISTIRDITEGKKYRNLLETTQQAGKIGGWEYDAISDYLSLTDEVYSILSLEDKNNLQFTDIYECFTDESKKRFERANRQSIEEGTSYNLELQLKRSGTSVKWVRIISKLVSVYNKTVKIYGVVQDITPKKLQEQTLERLASVAAKTSNPVLVLDSKRKIEWANESFLELYKYKLDEVYGKPCESFICPTEKNPDEIKKLLEELEKNNRFSGEILNYRSDGTPLWLHYDISPIQNYESEIQNYIAIGLDISERRLFEQQLLESKERAEELSLLKSNFLANMSHELRTPLVGILGYADLLKGMAEDEKLHQIGGRIYESGKRLLDTLNLLIDSSNMEANSLKVHKTAFSISKALEETVQYFSEKAKSKNLYLRVDIKTENLTIYQDARLVRQILNNLVSNAIKFTLNGGVTIKVDRKKRKNKEHIFISVSDTGIGIDAKDRDHIFEEFRQVSEGKERSFEGTGLGLSVTKKFVQSCGGTISFESESGVGSTFTVELPVDKKEASVSDSISSDAESESEFAFTEQLDLTVLLIEDDSSHVELTKAFLEKFCNVDVTFNREDALKHAKDNKYDLLFIDVNLGDELGGIGLAQEIRKIKEYKKIPLVAVSAFDIKDEDEMTSDIFNFYLSKPFNSKELRELIDTIIGNDTSKE